MKKRLQVFVSSTYKDLINERQAAVGAILKSGNIPAGMELFTAGDKSQLHIIKRWIDESDVYMLILGGRYGSLEPESGVSYTEIEYNYALESGKPLFAVVIKDTALESKVKLHGTAVIETDRPAELKLFREKVLSNVSSFYEDEKDIRLCVMESLPDIAATRELTGWISGAEVPNTKALVDEITALKSELAESKRESSELLKKLAKLEKTSNGLDFDELEKVLSSIEIAIPPEMVKGEKGVTRTLESLFVALQEIIITGVTNQTGQGQQVYFVYENICPKLQVHDLVKNEKVAGVRWRRFSITPKGQAYLAHVDRLEHLQSTNRE